MLTNTMNAATIANDRHRELLADSMIRHRNTNGALPPLSRRAARRQAELEARTTPR